MKLLIIFIGAWCVSVNAEVLYDYKGQGTRTCISQQYNMRLSLNQEKKVPGDCLWATCLSGGIMQFEGCGVVSVEGKAASRCRVSKKSTRKAWPDCCPQVYCDEE